MGNLIVGQSGGPTSVINSSLAGVFQTAKDRGANKVYGMIHGIKGLIDEKYVDLSEHIKNDLDIELLKRTPSAFLGSCRYMLPIIEDNEDLYNKIFTVLEKLKIEYFFYIGGNDSMDTIMKLNRYKNKIGSTIKFIGVPKTIDNDLAITDHTPGFGSAAKYIASTFKEIIRDGMAYGKSQVTIVEIMGRNAGWLAASAALSKGVDCEGPDLIYLPEVPLDLDKFFEKVEYLNNTKKTKSIVIAISEGVKLSDGRYVCELDQGDKSTDSFGHKSLGGTAVMLGSLIAEKFGYKVRPIEMSTLQRCAAHLASMRDIIEAFRAGGEAVKSAFAGESGKVIVFRRVSHNPYGIVMEAVNVEEIANVEKKVPLEWIINDGTYVSEELIDYMRPLIHSELSPIMIDGLPRHLVLDDERMF